MLMESIKASYARLGLSEGASLDQVKASYHTLALRVHPDKNLAAPEATDEFQRLSDAYERVVRHVERSMAMVPIPIPDSAAGNVGGNAFGASRSPGMFRGFGFDPMGEGYGEQDEEDDEEEVYLYTDDGEQWAFSEEQGRFFRRRPAPRAFNSFEDLLSSMGGDPRSRDGKRGRMEESEATRQQARKEKEKWERLERQKKAEERERLKKEEEERKALLKELREREEREASERRKAQKATKKARQMASKLEAALRTKQLLQARQERRSAAFAAARRGEVDAVRKAVWEEGVDHSGGEVVGGMDGEMEGKVQDEGETLLHLAVQMGDKKLVEWLLDQGASPEERDSSCHTPFHRAIAFAHLPIIHHFLSTFDPYDNSSSAIYSIPANASTSTLQLAVESANADVVFQVLDKDLAGIREIAACWQWIEAQPDADGAKWMAVKRVLAAREGFNPPTPFPPPSLSSVPALGTAPATHTSTPVVNPQAAAPAIALVAPPSSPKSLPKTTTSLSRKQKKLAEKRAKAQAKAMLAGTTRANTVVDAETWEDAEAVAEKEPQIPNTDENTTVALAAAIVSDEEFDNGHAATEVATLTPVAVEPETFEVGGPAAAPGDTEEVDGDVSSPCLVPLEDETAALEKVDNDLHEHTADDSLRFDTMSTLGSPSATVWPEEAVFDEAASDVPVAEDEQLYFPSITDPGPTMRFASLSDPVPVPEPETAFEEESYADSHASSLPQDSDYPSGAHTDTPLPVAHSWHSDFSSAGMFTGGEKFLFQDVPESKAPSSPQAGYTMPYQPLYSPPYEALYQPSYQQAYFPPIPQAPVSPPISSSTPLNVFAQPFYPSMHRPASSYIPIQQYSAYQDPSNNGNFNPSYVPLANVVSRGSTELSSPAVNSPSGAQSYLPNLSTSTSSAVSDQLETPADTPVVPREPTYTVKLPGTVTQESSPAMGSEEPLMSADLPQLSGHNGGRNKAKSYKGRGFYRGRAPSIG